MVGGLYPLIPTTARLSLHVPRAEVAKPEKVSKSSLQGLQLDTSSKRYAAPQLADVVVDLVHCEGASICSGWQISSWVVGVLERTDEIFHILRC